MFLISDKNNRVLCLQLPHCNVFSGFPFTLFQSAVYIGNVHLYSEQAYCRKYKPASIKWKSGEDKVELKGLKKPLNCLIVWTEVVGRLSLHLWFHSSELNDTSNNILLHRCKVYKLSEENGASLKCTAAKASAASIWQGAWLGSRGAQPKELHTSVSRAAASGEAGAQAPSFHT